MGLGEKKTPNSFIVACDKFIYIEILKQQNSENEQESTETTASPKMNTIRLPKKKFVLLRVP